MGLILDTDQLIPVEKRGMTALEALATLGAMRADEAFAISVITIAELRHGAERAVTASQRLRRESFLEELMLAVFVQPLEPFRNGCKGAFAFLAVIPGGNLLLGCQNGSTPIVNPL